MGMPNQVVYETNADYYLTWKNLTENSLVAAVDRTEKGLLWFRLKRTNTIFLLSPNGRLQVKWDNEEEKKILLEVVKALLIPKGGALTVKPLKQQLWANYPPPAAFNLLDLLYVARDRDPLVQIVVEELVKKFWLTVSYVLSKAVYLT